MMDPWFSLYSKNVKLYNTQEKGSTIINLQIFIFSTVKQELLEIESMGFTDESHNYPSKEPSNSQQIIKIIEISKTRDHSIRNTS